MAKFESDNDKDLNLEATELRLGLPGCTTTTTSSTTHDKESHQTCTPRNKRALPTDDHEDQTQENPNSSSVSKTNSPPTKAQVVGWPPVRSYRKNSLRAEQGSFVKVSMDGAPYLRKMDMKVYGGYSELLKALEDMFKFKAGEYSESRGYTEFVPTYEDKDGDWMLLGDVPWDMFITSCKRLRVMKGSDARGLGCAV